MEERQGPVSRISRRRMLKRIGAGAAVAWSAPILSTIRTPAFAQYGPPACTQGSACFSCPDGGCTAPRSPDCGTITDCLSADWCGCVTTAEGANACVANRFGAGACASGADCPANEVCIPICATGCGLSCIPRCGTARTTRATGRLPSSSA